MIASTLEVTVVGRPLLVAMGAALGTVHVQDEFFERRTLLRSRPAIMPGRAADRGSSLWTIAVRRSFIAPGGGLCSAIGVRNALPTVLLPAVNSFERFYSSQFICW